MCDEISTERDSSRVNSLNSSTISSRTIGSRPFVGSSSSSSFASCASAAAIETFILLPRESSANGFFLQHAQPSKQRRVRLLRPAPLSAFEHPAEPLRRKTRGYARLVEHDADLLLHLLKLRAVVVPQHRNKSRRRAPSCRIRRISVLLPAPFSPISPRMQPPGSIRSMGPSRKPGYDF